MKDQIRAVSLDTVSEYMVLSIDAAEQVLISIATYCTGPRIDLHGITPTDARMIIDALTPLAQQSDTTEAGETAQVAR